MASLEIGSFSSLSELAKAYVKVHPLTILGPTGLGIPHGAIQEILAGPALVAYWITRFAPSLVDRPELHLTVVSAVPDSFEATDRGRWYSLLPVLLGAPGLRVHVTVVRTYPEVDDPHIFYGRLPIGLEDAEIRRVSLGTYLETCDEPIDLLVLNDVATHIRNAEEWVDGLNRAAKAGCLLAAVSSNADEFEIFAGLLALHGFEKAGDESANRFAVSCGSGLRRMWGGVVWQIDASRFRANQRPSDGTLDELYNLYLLIDLHGRSTGEFLPLREYGVLANVCSPDGAPLVVLPRALFFCPSSEKFFRRTEVGDLAAVEELDNYGARSALLASRDGRTTSFDRILWAVRVFMECLEIVPSLDPNLDAAARELVEELSADEEDDDSRPCPHCGGVHSATERIESMKGILSDIFEGETTKTQLRAALSLALDIVDRDNEMSDDGSDDEHDDAWEDGRDVDQLTIFNGLLDHELLRTAVGMVIESDEGEFLIDMGCDEDGWSLLLLALLDGQFDLVEQLLELGADASYLTVDGGVTAFHALAMSDAGEYPEEIFALLLQYGANPNARDADGVTPIELAAFDYDWNLVAKLLDIGADLRGTGLEAGEMVRMLREEGYPEQADRIEGKKKRTRQARLKAPVPPLKGPTTKGRKSS